MKATDIKNVVCYASGVIGSGWAIDFAVHGMNTIILDINQKQLDDARNRVEKGLNVLLENGVLSQASKQAALDRIIYTTDTEAALKSADFIQESGPENMKIKNTMYENVYRYAREDCILASSTSGFPPSQLFENCQHKDRCIVAHPFNPPHLMPLVELCTINGENNDTAKTVRSFFEDVMMKEPVLLLKEATGFIGNRFLTLIDREMTDLLYRGVASAEDLNRALVYGCAIRWMTLGHQLIYECASDQGLRQAHKNWGQSGRDPYAALADWHKVPEGANEMVYDAIEEMKNNLPDEIGHTIPELVKYRDEKLVELLKWDGKIK